MYFCIVTFIHMATVHYLYRSTREKGLLEVRLQHLQLMWTAKSPIEVTRDFWNNQRKSKSRNIDIRNEQVRVEKECSELENNILNSFKNTIPEMLPKDWLKGILNPTDKSVSKVIPTTLIEYIDYYIDYRKHELNETSRKKYNVIKQKLKRLQEHRKRPILIKEVNDSFKNEFVDYCKSKQYAQNTIHRDFVFIKTFCKHARFLGVETSIQLDSLRLDRASVEKIYLTIEDITAIEKIEENKLSDSLKNVRDWLIISCFTGQRISDFMRFNSEMIRIENDKKLIEFKQVKTGKLMTVPLHPKVIEILDKNNGSFPYPISDQKYNDYLKEVCEIAGLTTMVKGSKLIETNGLFRKVSKEYRKCDLVSSHIGRRSFATNFYGKIPTTYLIYVTGHSSEEMFLNYIGKSNKDLALEILNYF